MELISHYEMFFPIKRVLKQLPDRFFMQFHVLDLTIYNFLRLYFYSCLSYFKRLPV
jgi:hypothetical protein